MARNSMGQFMAALRKANGMTQQEVADRLCVSNKAVSRWERDECAPDISLIPAIAEMYGVTCDELLRGERISRDAETREEKDGVAEKGRTDKKAERQRKALIGRALSGFKTMALISIALSVVGLIFMFGISYGFWRPVVGFAVLLLFEATAAVLLLIAVNKLKEIKAGNELFEDLDAETAEHFDRSFGGFTFHGFFITFSAVVLPLPLLFYEHRYIIVGVLEFREYLPYLVFEVLLLVLLYLSVREPFIRLVTGRKKENSFRSRSCILLNVIQLTAWVLALILTLVLRNFRMAPEGIMILLTGVIIVAFAVLLFREKENRRIVFLTGLRNVLLLPTIFMFSAAHSVVFTYNAMLEESYRRGEIWNEKLIFGGICWTLLIMILYLIAKNMVKYRIRVRK
ncbi:MAG: helix-turn-helix transcriptional regulator [Lachnospiraceae bacterium]|nr:helix-turn-helix transcriptional regulator [Lachnospiraceae bacterium]